MAQGLFRLCYQAPHGTAAGSATLRIAPGLSHPEAPAIVEATTRALVCVTSRAPAPRGSCAQATRASLEEVRIHRVGSLLVVCVPDVLERAREFLALGVWHLQPRKELRFAMAQNARDVRSRIW